MLFLIRRTTYNFFFFTDFPPEMQLPRWRNVLLLNYSLMSSTRTATRFESFHSTPASCEKWKDKWSFDAKSCQQPSKDAKSYQQPSRNFIRYATRQKRADAKKVLKDLLINSGYSSKIPFQNIQNEAVSGGTPKKQRSKSCRHAQKSHHKKMKRKPSRESFYEDGNHPETIFHATNSKRWYTWSFNSQRDSFFQDFPSRFEWREQSSWKDKSTRWENISDIESDGEQCTIGSCSDRQMLDLPPTGPLKTEDVKKAFHLSALKWHPDKHQGPSQEMAAEKFRLCVNAYQSLCNALSSA